MLFFSSPKNRAAQLSFPQIIIADYGSRWGLAEREPRAIDGVPLAWWHDDEAGLTSNPGRDRKQATLSLNVQFVSPVRVGEFVIAECSVVKRTRSIMFMQGTLRVEDRICATVQGTWKILEA